jgi:hypothetical protein
LANSGQLPGTFQAEVAPVLRQAIPDPDWPEPVTVIRRRHAREQAPA